MKSIKAPRSIAGDAMFRLLRPDCYGLQPKFCNAGNISSSPMLMPDMLAVRNAPPVSTNNTPKFVQCVPRTQRSAPHPFAAWCAAEPGP
jgi:hypothetical protein